jgi:hypothetical protein
MRRKLFRIEEILDGNLVCLVQLEGRFREGQVRTALARVQRKHPALRTLIREEEDGLYFECDAAPEIPLRVVLQEPAELEDACCRECRAELTTDFSYDQPPLRAVWLPGNQVSGFVFATTHRVCDGMSLLILVREVLRAMYSDRDLTPYAAVSPAEIAAGYVPRETWKSRVAVSLVNGLLSLVPPSRVRVMNEDHFLEWSADNQLSARFRGKCRAEGVSVHAALVVALDRALQDSLGEQCPQSIDNQIDPRRGRIPELRDDMLFLGGGGFKVRTGQDRSLDFWERARQIQAAMPGQIAKEIEKIPWRFRTFEKLRRLSCGQVQTLMRIHDGLQLRGRRNSFALSNWGNVDVLGPDAPFRLKDFRVYVHSFKTKVLGMVPYTVDGRMRFYCVSHPDCMSPEQMLALRESFSEIMEQETATVRIVLRRQVTAAG